MSHLGHLAVVVALLMTTALSTTAEAGYCGDDIDGVRVSCACGDIVSSDTLLLPGDPIVSGRCYGHGLTVRADRVAESITLNLGGLAIVGSGRGVGVKIEYGGTDGAVVLGGHPPRLGEVVGFGYGVTATTPNALARLDRVTAKGNVHGGFMLRQAGAIVQEIAAMKNGGDGVRIFGTGGRFLGLRADENERRGITVNASGAVVNGTANLNGTHGVVVPAPNSRLVGVEAHANRVDGIVAQNWSQVFSEISATGNGGADMRLPEGLTAEMVR